MEQLKVN